MWTFHKCEDLSSEALHAYHVMINGPVAAELGDRDS